MRLYSFACLLCVFLVILDNVTCYPAADPDGKDLSVKRHGKLAKKRKTHHRHSSRGLKLVSDYDIDLLDEPVAWAADADAKSGKLRRIGGAKNEERRKDRQGKSKKRKSKRSDRKNKRSRDMQRKLAASLRTARRADPEGPLYDATLDDGTPKQQLLGLGVFGDMRKFFDELRTNLDADEAAAVAFAESERIKSQDPSLASIADSGFEEYEELPNYQALRTMGSDAGLTAPDREHQQRRQSRLRGFVSTAGWPSEPSRHHRARQYLRTGLGR